MNIRSALCVRLLILIALTLPATPAQATEVSSKESLTPARVEEAPAPGPLPPRPADLSKILESIERMNAGGTFKATKPMARPKPLRFGGMHLKPAPSSLIEPEDVEFPSDGRWHHAPLAQADNVIPDDHAATIEQLEAIGYLSGTELATGSSGVTVHDVPRTSPGVNLYTSGHAPTAILMDASGKTLHQWHIDFAAVWPDHPKTRLTPDAYFFRRAYLLPEGDLLAIFEGYGLIRLDKHSKLLWSFGGRAHHDLDFLPNDDICVLARRGAIIERINPKRAVLEDFLCVLDPATGKERHRISLLEAVEKSEFNALWRRDLKNSGDIFHTNTVHVLDGRVAETLPAFKKGNVIVSIRNQDFVAVVDMEAKTVVWAHKGPYRRQHDPKLLDNGNLLVFDNIGRRGTSTVYEFDPATMEVRWEYSGTPEKPFYSRTCGTAHRLANGNTLITASDAGFAFEVTPDKETVWEFHNPNRAGEQEEFIATLFNVDRIPPDVSLDWVDPKTIR